MKLASNLVFIAVAVMGFGAFAQASNSVDTKDLSLVQEKGDIVAQAEGYYHHHHHHHHHHFPYHHHHHHWSKPATDSNS